MVASADEIVPSLTIVSPATGPRDCDGSRTCQTMKPPAAPTIIAARTRRAFVNVCLVRNFGLGHEIPDTGELGVLRVVLDFE
jgi:hypothetical protein